MQVTEKLILKELDPTGCTVKKYTMKFETSDGDSMKDYRFLLTIGKYEYYMNYDGRIGYSEQSGYKALITPKP